MAQSLSSFRSIDLSIVDVGSLEFEKKLEDRLVCPVCKNVLQRPMQMSCGHHVCQKCLDKVFEKGGSTSCPVNADEDCKVIQKNEVFHDASVGREVMKLKVKCPNKKYGCPSVITLMKIQDHVKQCQYQSVKCDFPGCNKEMAKQSINQHQESCEFKPVECPLCHVQISSKDLKDHKENECPESLAECQYHCGTALMKRITLDQHYNNCPKKPDECGYKYFRCNFTGTSEEMACHMIADVVCHVELIAVYISGRDNDPLIPREQVTTNVPDEIKSKIAACEKQAKDLMLKMVSQAEKNISLERKVSELPRKSVLEQQSRELNDLKERVANLTEQMRNMDGGATITRYGTLNSMADAFTTQLAAHDRQLGNHDVRIAEMDLRFQIMETASYNGVIIWKIKDFKRRKNDAVNGRTLSLYSQPFYTSKYGYKMCIRVYLNGDGMGRNTHLSLFFVVMGGEFDSLLPWPFQQKVTLYILDQGTSGRHLSDHFHPDASSSSFKRPTGEMNVASGCPLFVSHSVLENRSNSYVKDDILFIRSNVDTSGLSNF